MADRRARAVLGTVAAVAVSLVGACTGGSEAGPARTGLASGIEAAVAPYVAPEDPVRAVLAVVDGETVYEKYYDSSAGEYRDVYSVTKSVMSTLVGIAIGEGHISGTGATLGELLPQHAEHMTKAVSRITLHQVLTMTGGFAGAFEPLAWNVDKERDPVSRILADSAVLTPGREFVYSDVGAHLTSPILEKATGMEVLDYARSRLFDPLGIPSDSPGAPLVLPYDQAQYEELDFAWPVDRDGHNLGFGHLRLRPVDMAKLGQLYLEEGRWEGKQVVPADWVRQATSDQLRGQQASLEGSYGYLWWTLDLQGAPAYSAIGFGGQRVEVVPDLDLVVVLSTEADPFDPDDPDYVDRAGITDTHATQIADAVIRAVRDAG